MTKKDTPAVRHTAQFPNIRVPPDELAAIKANAVAAGLSFSAYVRHMCLNGHVPAPPSTTDQEALRLLSAAGRNVNQIAKSGHIHRHFDTVALHETLAEIRAAVSRFLP